MQTFAKIFSKIKSFFGHMGFYFVLIVMTVNAFITIAYPNGGKVFNTDYFWYILLFSAIYALCNFVLEIKFIESYLAKLSVHFILIVADAAISIGCVAESSKTTVFVTIAFAFFYLIVEGVRAAFYFATHKKKNETTEYTPLFSK